MSDYRLTVGLEVHAELKTATKMFCSCRNDPDEHTPNPTICPVCMAHPGTLPVINKEAVHHVLLVGAALGSKLADEYTEFDRKNYFYPDIPKGYQISQYKYPLVQGGSLNSVAITRVHLEEDTARSQHPSTNSGQADISLVDFNRSGVPLMELVTEPVMHSPKEVGDFARELQLLLRTLGVSDADMEKGQMRVEANISVSRDEVLGTKVEVKNLNSFRAMERAISYEIERQTKLLDGGGRVAQETRGWDENTQATFSQRSKESAEDYRYFPEPDLPKLVISEIPEFAPEILKKELPELPWERRAKYIARGLKADDADMFVQQRYFGDFFDKVVEILKDEKLILLAANYIANDIASGAVEKESSEIKIKNSLNASRPFAELIRMNGEGILSSRATKDLLHRVVYGGEDPKEIAEREGLVQQNDEATLGVIVGRVLAAHPGPAADYRAGKEASLQFLVGQGMKESKGAANPQELRKYLVAELARKN